MQKYQDVIQDQAGNALSGWSVTVNLTGTSTAASIFSDNAFTVKANPFVNNTDGTFAFLAANGEYDLTFVNANAAFTIPNRTIILFDDTINFITPTVLAANTNDYNPTNGAQTSLWRISASGAINLTGIAAPLANAFMSPLFLINIGTFSITVTNQDVNSQAANRVITGTGASVVLAQDQSMTLAYDPTTTRWRKIT